MRPSAASVCGLRPLPYKLNQREVAKLFCVLCVSGELNKKGATHFVSTETEDEVRAWLAGI